FLGSARSYEAAGRMYDLIAQDKSSMVPASCKRAAVDDPPSIDQSPWLWQIQDSLAFRCFPTTSPRRFRMSSDRLRQFYRLAWVAFVLLFLVTVAGSIVRASGSGMGCPDWPLCFGQVVPPTDESQLPEGYEETYAVQGRPAVFNAFN